MQHLYTNDGTPQDGFPLGARQDGHLGGLHDGFSPQGHLQDGFSSQGHLQDGFPQGGFLADGFPHGAFSHDGHAGQARCFVDLEAIEFDMEEEEPDGPREASGRLPRLAARARGEVERLAACARLAGAEAAQVATRRTLVAEVLAEAERLLDALGRLEAFETQALEG